MNKQINNSWILILLLLVFLILAISSMINNSYTDNEPIYILQGYGYLIKGETFGSGHPIFAGFISAIPLLFIDIDFPKFEEIYHIFRFARNELLFYGSNNPDQIIFLSRLPFIILAVLFGIYVFKWANDLYSAKAGLFALFLYILNPDIIANSTLVMTDLPVAGFMFICMYYYWKLNCYKEKGRYNLLLSGIFFGLSITTKCTSLFLLPLFLILPLFYNKKIKEIFYHSLIILLIGIFIFMLINIRDFSPIYTDNNPFYSGSQSKEFRSDERLDQLITSTTNNPLLTQIIKFSLTKVPVFGANSIQAYLLQIRHSEVGHPQYFMGEYTMHGVWYYYFIVYLIKTPIPLIILFLGSFIFFNRLRNHKISNELYLISIIGTVLFIVSFLMELNLGLRHTLVIPLIGFVLISKIIGLFKSNIFYKILIVTLIIWYALISIMIYPYYISYFNEFVGGPNNGYKYLIDSSLDLGQDLKRLGFYLDENPISDIKLRYAGFEKPGYRGIEYTNLTCEPTTGNVIISASALEGLLYYEGKNTPDLGCYSWLRKLEPVDKVGYSIFIYNVSEQDLSRISNN